MRTDAVLDANVDHVCDTVAAQPMIAFYNELRNAGPFDVVTPIVTNVFLAINQREALLLKQPVDRMVAYESY